MRKKLLLITFAVLILAATFTACNPKDKNTVRNITYDDIFLNHNGITEYSSSELAFAFPDGVSPFTGTGNSVDYANAFVEEYNLLICKKSYTPEGATASITLYGVYSIDSAEFIGEGVSYTQFNVNYGFISLVDESGICLLYNYKGTKIIGAEHAVKLADFDASSISDVIIPVSADYYVVRHDKNKYDTTFYLYDLFRADGTAVKNNDGTPFSIKSKYYGNVKYKNYIFGLKAVDDYLVSSTYYSSYSTRKTQDVIYYDINSGKKVYDVFKERGTMDTSTQTREAFYLGDGKLYCYQQEKSTKDDGYIYSVGENYYKILIWTYDINQAQKEVQSPNLIYFSIINKYNQEQTSLSNYDYFVKDGYSLGNLVYLRNADKTVNNDQYIIDSNLSIYVSAYTHAGTATKYSAQNDNARDVLLTFVDGVGFNAAITADTATDLMVYDDKGNTILLISGYFYNVFYNNGIVTANQLFYDDKGNETGNYCAAFRIDGTPLFDAEAQKYSEMSAYVGEYAIAKTAAKKIVLVDKNGNEVKDITSEIYFTGSDTVSSSKTYHYKAGVYVTKTADGYGMKAYDGTVIFTNSWSYEVIDKYGTKKVLFYVKDTAGKWYLYLIK